jgi:hypothetical protein
VTRSEIGASRDEFTSSDELEPWVRARRPVKTATGWRQYAPLRSNTALFRTFADLECDQKSILGFADRFGLLTEPEREPLRVWTAAIADMQFAVGSWEDVQIPNPDPSLPFSATVAGRVASWAQKAIPNLLVPDNIPGETRDNYIFEMGVLAGAGLSRRSKDGDVLDFLAAKISDNISHVRTVFVSNYDSVLQGFTHRLIPKTLLEAMWLQLGQAVESNKTFRKCRHCDTWFDLSPKAARADKVFCSEACKAKAYRRRLAEQEHAEVRVNEPSDREPKCPQGGQTSGRIEE